MAITKNIPFDDLSYIFDNVGSLFERLRNKNIFITGGTGIIGTWLVEALLHANNNLSLNIRIFILTRHPDRFLMESPSAKYVEIIQGDVRSFKMPDGIVFDYVIHGATDVINIVSQKDVLSTCILGTEKLLSEAEEHGVTRILLLSSGAVYGKTPLNLNRIPENFVGSIDFRSPESAYAEGKRCAELMCAIASQSGKIIIPVARCFAMVGPFVPIDKHFAIGNFIGSAIRSEEIIIKGDGTPERTFLYMSDVILRLLILFLDGDSMAYNIGGREAISIKDLAFKVASIINPSLKITIKGKNVHGSHANRYLPSVELFDTKWSLPSPITLDQAILKTAKWHLQQD